MKRIALLTLALVTAAAILAGCASSPTATTAATTAATQPAATTAPPATAAPTAAPTTAPEPTATPLPQVSLTWYAMGDKPKDFDEVFVKLNEKTTADIHCTVETKFISWADASTKYALVFASGEKFDMIFTADWCQYAQQSVKNGFYELTSELLQKYAPKVWEMTPPEAWSQAKINGKIFMVPQNAESFNHVGAVIRGDLREKYGLPEVNSVAAFEQYLDAIAANEKEIIPYNAASTESWMTQIEFTQPNGYFSVPGGCVIKLSDPTATPIPAVDLPEYQNFFEKMREFNQKGYWSKNVLNNTTSSTDGFLNGTSACGLHNMETVCGTWRKAMNAHPEWKPEVCDLMENFPTYAGSYIVNGMAIFAFSENPERSLMWIDKMRSDQECYDLITYGIEGKHWKNEGDGKMSPGPNAADYGATYSTWGFVTKSLVRNDTGRWPEWNSMMEKYSSRAVVNPVVYMSFDNSAVKNEIAAINNIGNKYWGVLLYGFDADPVALDKKVTEQYNAAGQDKVLNEWIRQRDAYLANYNSK